MFTCKSITTDIAGEKVELRMDFNALAMVEKMTGKNLLDQKIWEDMDVTTMTILFYACAVQCNGKLTLQDIRGFGFKYATEMMEAVRAAWRAALDAPAEVQRPMNGSKIPVEPLPVSLG